ncbi:MAG: hypothetical protein ACYS47_08160, partial [Planctomycetota bacterium]|jgi:pentatricopeptide repeat protein
VNEYKAKMEALQKEFEKADALLDKGKFEDATKLLEKMTKNKLNPDIADGALARIEEIKMGKLFMEGVKALEEKNFDLAQVRLTAVADSEIDNRWASRAWDLAKTIPAAKLYNEGVALADAGKNYEAMQMLQKVVAMEDAGHYGKLAAKKIQELKNAWRNRSR